MMISSKNFHNMCKRCKKYRDVKNTKQCKQIFYVCSIATEPRRNAIVDFAVIICIYLLQIYFVNNDMLRKSDRLHLIHGISVNRIV